MRKMLVVLVSLCVFAAIAKADTIPSPALTTKSCLGDWVVTIFEGWSVDANGGWQHLAKPTLTMQITSASEENGIVSCAGTIAGINRSDTFLSFDPRTGVMEITSYIHDVTLMPGGSQMFYLKVDLKLFAGRINDTFVGMMDATFQERFQGTVVPKIFLFGGAGMERSSR